MTESKQAFRVLWVGCLILGLAVQFACGSSPAERRKAAQANGDKYFEFLKAEDYEGAYRHTFSTAHKQQLPIETFVRFRQAYAAQTGKIVDYEVVEYSADPEKEFVTLVYSIRTDKFPVPVSEVVKMQMEGTEWRIASIEPRRPTIQPANSNNQNTSIPMPQSNANR